MCVGPVDLAPVKSRLVLPFWYRLTQVVLEKRPLNGCSSSNPTLLLLLQTVGPARVRVLVAGIAAVVVAVAQLALVDAADAGAQRALEVIESARVLRCNAATTDTELLIAA